MSQHVLLFALAATLSHQPAYPQAAPAQARGTIADDQGKPVAGARILFSRKPRVVRSKNGRWRLAPGEVAFSSQAFADVNGRFQISQLPPGNYEFCIDASGYLPTCQWTGWRWTTLASGQVFDHGVIRLARAATITIEISDPQRRVGGANAAILPLSVGVRELSGKFHPARRVEIDGTSHVFQVDVPYDTPLHVWLHSWKLQLTDSRGAVIGRSGVRLPFLVASNTVQQPFTFQVVGEVRGAI